jgi:hypothetical protein
MSRQREMARAMAILNKYLRTGFSTDLRALRSFRANPALKKRVAAEIKRHMTSGEEARLQRLLEVASLLSEIN